MGKKGDAGTTRHHVSFPPAPGSVAVLQVRKKNWGMTRYPLRTVLLMFLLVQLTACASTATFLDLLTNGVF